MFFCFFCFFFLRLGLGQRRAVVRGYLLPLLAAHSSSLWHGEATWYQTFVVIGPGCSLLPVQCQAITWTNGDYLWIWPLWTKLNEILIKICSILFIKMHLKMLSAKCQPLCSDLNMLTSQLPCWHKLILKLVPQWASVVFSVGFHVGLRCRGCLLLWGLTPTCLTSVVTVPHLVLFQYQNRYFAWCDEFEINMASL